MFITIFICINVLGKRFYVDASVDVCFKCVRVIKIIIILIYIINTAIWQVNKTDKQKNIVSYFIYCLILSWSNFFLDLLKTKFKEHVYNCHKLLFKFSSLTRIILYSMLFQSHFLAHTWCFSALCHDIFWNNFIIKIAAKHFEYHLSAANIAEGKERRYSNYIVQI